MSDPHVSQAKREQLERRMAELGVREDELVEKFIRGGGKGGQKRLIIGISKDLPRIDVEELPQVREDSSSEGDVSRRKRPRQVRSDAVDRLRHVLGESHKSRLHG